MAETKKIETAIAQRSPFTAVVLYRCGDHVDHTKNVEAGVEIEERDIFSGLGRRTRRVRNPGDRLRGRRPLRDPQAWPVGLSASGFSKGGTSGSGRRGEPTSGVRGWRDITAHVFTKISWRQESHDRRRCGSRPQSPGFRAGGDRCDYFESGVWGVVAGPAQTSRAQRLSGSCHGHEGPRVSFEKSLADGVVKRLRTAGEPRRRASCSDPMSRYGPIQ